MIALRDAHISTKLTLLCVATSAVALASVVIAFFIQDYRLVQKIKTEQVHSQVSMLQSNLSHSLGEGDFEAAHAVLTEAQTPHGIVGASLNSEHDQFFTGLAEQHQLAEQFAGWWFPIKQQTLMFNTQGLPTTVTLYIGYNDVEARLFYLLGYALMAFALAIAIAFALARAVQRWLSRPLLSLYELSQQVVAGNYQVRSDITSNDEIGRLARAFNEMLSQIENRDLMLEKQVNQRTRELQKLAHDFRYRALHDTLTGLPNRTLLLEEFKRAVAHAKRVGKFFSVLMLDLDDFKSVNDTLGHEAGDELLKYVANTLRTALRGEDIVCRLGGDEFVLLIEDVDSEHTLRQVGKNILAALATDVRLPSHVHHLGVSIGAAIYPQHGSSLAELKHHADVAMYRAKQAGKNQLVVFDRELAYQNKHKLLLQNELKCAAYREQLELHFQPQVDTRLKIVVGCEVFLRWHHQGLGFLQPADFISYAEETGAIAEMDYFVLREACRVCHEWRRLHDVHLPMSVNISSVHFRSEAIVEVLQQALQEYQLPANFITLELRDDVLLDKTGVATTVMQKLKALGVQFCLGELGVGYFSMQHWQNAHVHCAQLHRSVINTMTRNKTSQAFITAVLTFADELGMSVIAQGVEQSGQVKLLQNLGCHLMQGFVFAPPMRQQQFLDWLTRFSDLNLPAVPQMMQKPESP